MMRMLDCLVNYFGLDDHERAGYSRYFCYHVVAGPGSAVDEGLALIKTLAIYDERERCRSCEALHTVETGGPTAALAAALRYLDSYHAADHLLKVQSSIRGLDECQAPEGVSRPPARSARLKLESN